MYIQRLLSITAASFALTACTKPADPVVPPATTAKPTDDSAAGRAAAAMAASQAAGNNSDKVAADIARIRELKEQETAEKNAAKKANQTRGQQMTEGAAQPIRELKY